MKKVLCTVTLVCLLFMTGCGRNGMIANLTHQLQGNASDTAAFVSGMGCSDPSCTDTSHHHDCPSDCGDYEHHHNCGLDCAEVSHHHGDTVSKDSQSVDSTTDTNVSFVSGMGCSDPSCTDTSHHHDCPTDCGDYEHHHNCGLDCTEVSHHHIGTGGRNESGQHHSEPHHGGHHH